jgi:hypothetical protein
VRKQLETTLGKLGKADDNDDEADGLVRGLDLTEFAGFMGVESMLWDTASDRGADVLLSLGISEQSDFFDHANDRAAAYAKDRAAWLVTKIDESTRNTLRNIIADGLAEGKMRDDIIDEIFSMRDADGKGIFNEERAGFIADHEVAMASGDGAQVGREEAIKAGVDLDKGWFCDDDPCELCEENQNAGWIPNDEEFPSGDMTEVAHNKCRCHTESRVKERSESDDDE